MLAVQHEAIDLASAYDFIVKILDPLDDVCYRLELSVNSVKSLGFDILLYKVVSVFCLSLRISLTH